jgi:NADH dehydrogenase
MKVLVTGGTGYVGSGLRTYIKSQGHDVRLLVRPGSEGTSDGCDAVVHLIGIIREQPSKGITFDQYHRAATANIVDAAQRCGAQRYIHMSALGVHEHASSSYHKTKYAAEQLVQQSSLRWTIFRPSWIFGPGNQGTQEIVDLVHKPIVPLINGGKMLIQPIALEDVCALMSEALLMPETQHKVYELGGPDRLSLKEIIEKVAAQLGAHIRTVDVPSWSIKPVVAALERFPSFPLTIDQMRMLSVDNVCELDSYVKTFQIEPKPFAQILPTLLDGSASPRKPSILL